MRKAHLSLDKCAPSILCHRRANHNSPPAPLRLTPQERILAAGEHRLSFFDESARRLAVILRPAGFDLIGRLQIEKCRGERDEALPDVTPAGNASFSGRIGRLGAQALICDKIAAHG
jgi:hypothetical protein